MNKKRVIWDIDRVKEYVESNSDCIPLFNSYNNARQKYKFKCKCGAEFEVVWYEFTKGKQCCNECSWDKLRQDRKSGIDNIKNQINDIYDCKYTVLSDSFKNQRSKISVKCNTCNNTWCPTIDNLLREKVGCPVCAGELSSVKQRKTQEKFCFDMNKIYYDKFKVVGKYINSTTKIEIKCTKCDCQIYRKPNALLCKLNKCPNCESSSSGEVAVAKWLNDSNKEYIQEYKFKDCKNILPLPFDFYLPNYNLLIEYDGEGHYEPFRFSKNKQKMLDKFNQQKKHDNIKNTYCKINNIKLLRIPYWEFDNIELILKEALFEKYSAFFIA